MCKIQRTLTVRRDNVQDTTYTHSTQTFKQSETPVNPISQSYGFWHYLKCTIYASGKEEEEEAMAKLGAQGDG